MITRASKSAQPYRRRRLFSALLLWVTALGLAMFSGAAISHATEKAFDPTRGERMPVGDGAFEVAGVPRGPVTIYTYRPASASANSPIWVVMPGMRRDAHRHLAFDYYDTWQPLAERYGAILLVPEFTAEKWPGVWSYNFGNVRSQHLQAKRWNETGFYVVEQAFRMAAGSLGSSRRKFSIFGHGAGGQFIQRYVLHAGCGMIDRAVAANPGWFMLPDSQYRYPFGLRGAPIPSSTLARSFACNQTLLLGTADVNYGGLRNDPEARAQGKTRYARGQFYFARARATAARMGTPFKWHLREVPGIGHEASRMAPAGAAILAGRALPDA